SLPARLAAGAAHGLERPAYLLVRTSWRYTDLGAEEAQDAVSRRQRCASASTWHFSCAALSRLPKCRPAQRKTSQAVATFPRASATDSVVQARRGAFAGTACSRPPPAYSALARRFRGRRIRRMSASLLPVLFRSTGDQPCVCSSPGPRVWSAAAW